MNTGREGIGMRRKGNQKKKNMAGQNLSCKARVWLSIGAAAIFVLVAGLLVQVITGLIKIKTRRRFAARHIEAD